MSTHLLPENKVAVTASNQYIYHRNNIWWGVDAETNEWEYLTQGSADFSTAIAVPGEEQPNIKLELEKLFETSTCEAIERYKDNGEVYRCTDDKGIVVSFVHNETGANYSDALLLFGTIDDYTRSMREIVVVNEYEHEYKEGETVTLCVAILDATTHLPSYPNSDRYRTFRNEAYNDWKYDI